MLALGSVKISEAKYLSTKVGEKLVSAHALTTLLKAFSTPQHRLHINPMVENKVIPKRARYFGTL